MGHRVVDCESWRAFRDRMHRQISITRVRIAFLIVLIASSTTYGQVLDSSVRPDTGKFHMQKSPWLALGLSAVVPGAGQVYLGQWYKVPFIAAGIGGCLAGAFVQNNRYMYTGDSVRHQLERGDTLTSLRYEQAREFYRDDRDKFYIYAALFYLANLLDAYIAAHLYDFDVSDPGPSPYLMMPMTSDEPWRFGVRMRF